MTDIARLGFDIDSAPARTAAKDLDRLAAAADKTERSAKKLSSASRELLRDEGGRFMTAAQSAGKYATEIDSLRAKYNPLYAASKQFEAQQAELNRALALGAVSLSQYDAAMTTLQGGMIRSGAAADTFGKQMNSANMHSANVFSQLNDISVMMASGQNPLVLAMQQGTQLNQVWGQMGNNIGSVGSALRGAFMSMISPMSLLTIGVIAGGAALAQWGMSAWGAEEKARTLEDAMGDLDSVSVSMKATQDILGMSVDELKEKYGSYASIVRQLASDLAQNQIAEMNNALSQSVIDSASSFDKFSASMDAASASSQYLAAEQLAAGGYATQLGAAVESTEQSIRNLMSGLGVTREEAIVLANAFDKVRKSASMEDRVANFNLLQNALRAAGVSADQLPPALNKAIAEAGQLAIRLAEGKKQAQDLSASAPGAGWMGNAVGETNLLIGRLIAARNVLNSMSGVYGEVGARGDPRQQGAMPGTTGTFNVENYSTGAGFSGSNGGGGGADPYAENLNRLVESLMTERETVDQWYNENLSILNDRRAQELLGVQGQNEAKLDLEREYQEKLAGIKEQGNQWGLKAALDGGAEIFGAMGAMNKDFLKAQAVFAAGSALISTYQGAAKELEKGTFGFATAAAVIAKGIGFVAAIKSAGAGSTSVSGSGGGGGGASAPSVSSPKAEPERVVRVDLIGEEWQVAMFEPIIEQLYKASGNGRVIIAKG